MKHRIEIKHKSFIEVYFNNQYKLFYIGLHYSYSNSATVCFKDRNMLKAIIEQLRSSTENEGVKQFNINEDEYISLKRTNLGVELRIKAGGDFTRNGFLGFMIEEQVKMLANALESLLRECENAK